jgi:hypothetical protein
VIQDFQRNRRRSQVAINEEHFLFGADSRHASLKEAGFDHVLKGAQVLKQRLHEGLRLALVKLRIDVVFAHRISETIYAYSFLGWHSTHWNIEMSRRLTGGFTVLSPWAGFAFAIGQAAEVERVLNGQSLDGRQRTGRIRLNRVTDAASLEMILQTLLTCSPS